MQLGDASAGERTEPSQLDEALNILDNALSGLVDLIECGGLDQLGAAGKISFWRRFEVFRNRLPVVDHALIADAEASDLAGEYCFSSPSVLLARVLLLSPSEAAARVRAAAALSPQTSKDGESVGPVLPSLAAAQRAGVVAPEQGRLWSGLCRSSPGLTLTERRWRLRRSTLLNRRSYKAPRTCGCWRPG
jgi:Domain of unknown function (DUF222)